MMLENFHIFADLFNMCLRKSCFPYFVDFVGIHEISFYFSCSWKNCLVFKMSDAIYTGNWCVKEQDVIFQSLFSVLFSPTLMEFRLMLSVILLSVLMTFLFTLNEMGLVICANNLSWFLNLTLTMEIRWVGVRSGLFF